MKANELMIGDRIRFKYLPRHDDEIFDGVVNSQMFLYPSDFEIIPIPITSEILEKNGFTVGKYKLPMSDKEIDKFSLSEVGDDYVREVVLFPLTMNCTWSFGSVDGTFIPVIQYLHQLQHALRLCGVEKEIEL